APPPAENHALSLHDALPISQAAVDSEAQVIVAHAVTNQPPDAEHLAPMLDRIAENCGRLPRNLSADAGYFSAENVALAEALGTRSEEHTSELQSRENLVCRL